MMLDRMKSWFDERAGLSRVGRLLREKAVPLHRHTVWYYTGGAVLFFLAVQIATGLLLVLYYRPTLGEAHSSVVRIVEQIPMGWAVRSVHSWSASMMIASMFVHLFAAWVLKAYRGPRELTWMSGVALMALSLGFGFTGYLLPWNGRSLAATKVGTDVARSVPLVGDWICRFLRGGQDVTGDTLTRFFGFHACALPLLALAVLAVHLLLVQRHGMSLPLSARREEVKSMPFWPNFAYREVRIWLVLFGLLMTVAVLSPPPPGDAADLMAPAPEGIKPEWYFLFLYQTLKIFPSRILCFDGDTVAVLLVLAAAMLFFALPLIDRKPEGRKGRIITAAAWAALIYAAAMTAWSLS